MTLEDIEGYIVGVVGLTISGLIGLVRNGDIKRIEAIEKKQEQQDSHIASEVHALRTEIRDNHSEIVALLVKR